MRLFLTLAVAMAGSLFPLLAAQHEGAAAGPKMPGQPVYEGTCARCHGPEGHGGKAPVLVPFLWNYSQALDIVRHGGCMRDAGLFGIGVERRGAEADRRLLEKVQLSAFTAAQSERPRARFWPPRRWGRSIVLRRRTRRPPPGLRARDVNSRDSHTRTSRGDSVRAQ